MVVLERLYTDRCDIFIFDSIKNLETNITENQKVLICEKQPCRISYKNLQSVEQGITPAINQVIKLFISGNIEIPAGSFIEVFRNEKKTLYKSSGIPALYSNHQEIILENATEYA